MALAHSNITVELKEIFLNNRPQELYDISSKGTVPVLCINDSIVIDESLDIMIWSLRQNDPECWFTENQRTQLDMVKENDIEFKYWLDRYKYYDRYPENDQTYYRNKCGEYLSKLNILLERENQYLLCDHRSLVDVAVFPFIRQCANVDLNWLNTSYPHLSNWLNHFIEATLFSSVMDKYHEYQKSQQPLIISFHEKQTITS